MSGSCNILFLTVWSLSRMKVQNAQPNLYILVKMSVEKYVIKWYIIGYLSLLWCCILLLSAVKSIFELITLSFWTANSIFSFIFLVFVTLHKNAPFEMLVVTSAVFYYFLSAFSNLWKRRTLKVAASPLSALFERCSALPVNALDLTLVQLYKLAFTEYQNPWHQILKVV